MNSISFPIDVKIALKKLIDSIGIKEYVNHETLISLVKERRVKEATEYVASYLGLPIKIELSFVSKGFTFSSEYINQDIKYENKNSNEILNKTIAQVSIPSNLPLYGTPNLKGFPIKVTVSEECFTNPTLFIIVIAHELSHILLYSIRHPDKENEYYTDLTAMLLGFSVMMDMGRTIVKSFKVQESPFSNVTNVEKKTIYGYLSEKDFNTAFQLIEKELSKKQKNKQNIIKRVLKYKKYINKNKKLIFYFSKYLEYIDKNPNKKFRLEDAKKIINFHSSEYTQNFREQVLQYERILNDYLKFLESLTYYNSGNLLLVKKQEEVLKNLKEKTEEQAKVVKDGLKIMKKYCGVYFKLKLVLDKFW